MRGLFLPIAVEGKYDTYINSMAVRYGLILSYIVTIALLFTFDVGSKDFFLYQFSILLILHLIVNTHFIFWFDRHFSLEKIIIDLTTKQALISLFKSAVTFALTFFIAFATYLFFEHGRVPTNCILSIVFPYIFANTFYGALNEGIKGFLKLIHFREA
jgi:hypothetical protein